MAIRVRNTRANIPRYHKDAEALVNRASQNFELQLRDQAKRIATNKRHDEVQSVDVEQAIGIVYERAMSNRKKEVYLVFGTFLAGLGAETVFGAVFQIASSGQELIVTPSLFIAFGVALIGTVITTVGLMMK